MNRSLGILLATVTMATVSHAVKSCPQFWHLYEGNCYRFYGERLTWSAAESTCNKVFTTNGMAHLVSIHSLDESNFAYDLYRSSTWDTPDWVYNAQNHNAVYGFWIGLYQPGGAGPFVYSDGTSFDYTRWKSGEPNNSYYGTTPEDCVHYWRRNNQSDIAREWNDMYCDELMSFMCKVKADDDC